MYVTGLREVVHDWGGEAVRVLEEAVLALEM